MEKDIEDIIEEYKSDRGSKLYNRTKSKRDICQIEGSYSLLKVTENYAQYTPALYGLANNLL